jgi:hypothetical protein
MKGRKGTDPTLGVSKTSDWGALDYQVDDDALVVRMTEVLVARGEITAAEIDRLYKTLSHIMLDRTKKPVANVALTCTILGKLEESGAWGYDRRWAAMLKEVSRIDVIFGYRLIS